MAEQKTKKKRSAAINWDIQRRAMQHPDYPGAANVLSSTPRYQSHQKPVNQQFQNEQRHDRCMQIVNQCYRRCLESFGSGRYGSGSAQSRCEENCTATMRNCIGQ